MRNPFKNLKLSRRVVLWSLTLMLVGFCLSVAIRAATIKDDAVHYHANFALYINGQRQDFSSFTFYEEVAACSVHAHDDPKPRAHMHDNNPGLVHVHADAVTWGHFFANLGYDMGRMSFETETNVYVDGQDGNTLTFVLNGQTIDSPMNQVIHSEDRLLINYGSDSEATITERFNTVQNDAHQANVTADPSACAGAHSLTWQDRLEQALGFPSGE
jgi:hypothetical protein